MDDLVREFLIESHENLDRLDRDLLHLEKHPENSDTLGRAFRIVHTIKGTCGFLAFNKLESLSHVGESLLSKMREGELQLNAEITTGLLTAVDAIRQVLAQIEETGTEGDGNYAELIAQLTRLNEGGSVKATLPAASALSAMQAPDSGLRAPVPADDCRTSDERRSGKDRRDAADSSLRIDVVLLDKLMHLIDELDLARNQILELTATQADRSLVGATQRIDVVTSELHACVMKVRMQPIGSVWAKLPRLVRDLALLCSKQVRIEMEGQETELDKTIIEAIKDPLTHVIRNSVDHGIEAPEVRMQRGKAPEGRIRLRAFHEDGQINIEISDDGGGIDPAKNRSTAVRRGLVSADRAGQMTDHEIMALVFLPGFSTAEEVSNISGRGVGMDVVKTNIEKIGGQVDIQSRVGEGTSIKIAIPFTGRPHIADRWS